MTAVLIYLVTVGASLAACVTVIVVSCDQHPVTRMALYMFKNKITTFYQANRSILVIGLAQGPLPLQNISLQHYNNYHGLVQLPSRHQEKQSHN